MWYLLPPIALFVYYLMVWQRATSMLRPRSVITRYHAPGGLSPSAVRYVWMGGSGLWSGGADARSLAAMLADLAHRKQLSIELSGSEFVLQRTPNGGTSPLTDEEQTVICRLLPSTELYAVKFDGRIFYTPARFELEKALWYSLRDTYFTENMRYRLMGAGAMLLSAYIVATLYASQWHSDAAIPAVGLLFAAVMLGSLAIDQLQDAPRLGVAGTWLRPAAPYLVSGGLAVAGIVVFSHIANQAFAVSAVAMLALNLLFGVRLRAPTSLGRQTLDEIAGYREFLESVERPVLDALTADGKSLAARIDEHLGYLIALDVRDHWGDKLTTSIVQVLDQEERSLRQ